MRTVVDICNQALGRIGVSMFIQDIKERSKEATICRQFYDAARDRCLEDYTWSFATRYAALQDIGNPPVDWAYRYRYPNDCLKARDLRTDEGRSLTGLPLPCATFSVVEDETNGGLAIVTNLETPVLVYTAQIINPALYSAKFVNALAWALASDIAGPLSSKPEYAKMAGDAYTVAINQAGTASLNEGIERQDDSSEFERARL